MNKIHRKILRELGVLPVKGKYIFYKRVNYAAKNTYESLWDKRVKYRMNEITKEDNIDLNDKVRVTTGLHCGSATEWLLSGGNTTIAVEVDKDDIVAFVDGSVRVRKLKVVDEYHPFDLLGI